jgi:uncharacterized protein YbbK (DUF523 family)
VSACLAGVDCSYDGSNRLCRRVKALVENGSAIALCPEVLGGSSVPREPCEIAGGDGRDVMDGTAKVMTRSGHDVTKVLKAGARKALGIARSLGIRKAILKSKSPSCGRSRIYDGTFSGRLRNGQGVTAALLAANGVKVYTERGPDEE